MRGTFVIDLARCPGCQTCRVACRDRAPFADDADLLRVEVHEGGAYPDTTLMYRVVHCFHCAKPACADVCPTQAISRQENGLVALDENACIGCGACVEACPFGAIAMLAEGVAAKCDGCYDELAQGWDPTCVRACPMRALRYEPVASECLSGNASEDTRLTLGSRVCAGQRHRHQQPGRVVQSPHTDDLPKRAERAVSVLSAACLAGHRFNLLRRRSR